MHAKYLLFVPPLCECLSAVERGQWTTPSNLSSTLESSDTQSKAFFFKGLLGIFENAYFPSTEEDPGLGAQANLDAKLLLITFACHPNKPLASSIIDP